MTIRTVSFRWNSENVSKLEAWIARVYAEFPPGERPSVGVTVREIAACFLEELPSPSAVKAKPVRHLEGKEFARVRKERGLTQTRMAEMFGVAQTTVAAWERRGTIPRRLQSSIVAWVETGEAPHTVLRRRRDAWERATPCSRRGRTRIS